MGKAVFLFGGVRALHSVISPMITYDIKKFASSWLSIEHRRSQSTVVRGRGLRYILGHVCTTPVARWNIARTPVHFDIFGPGASMRRTPLGIGAAEEGWQETSRFIISHREGARLTRNCLCSCPALSDASDTFEHTYHVYAERAAWWWWWTDVVRASCVPVPSRPQLCRTPLRAPPLCFFVRDKIINGQTEVRYPEVSASWQWRSSHLESTLPVFLLPPFSSSMCYRVWLRLTPWVIAMETT